MHLLFDHFERLADAPNGVVKLRELILQLAVRGKLVQQDPNDEPAFELLGRIQEKKKRLITNGHIKSKKPLPSIADAEISYILPVGWEWCRLGEITNYAQSPKVGPNEIPRTSWVLELEDVEKITSRLLRKERYETRPSKSTKNIFRREDVIYGKLRPYLDKVIVADEDGVCTTEMIPFNGYGQVSPYFLRYVLKSPEFISFANSSTHGMNLPRLGTDKARMALIPLPPLNEQKRIVAKVDQLMQLCDELEQQQEKRRQRHISLNIAALNKLTTASEHAEFNRHWHFVANNFNLLYTDVENVSKLKQAILQLAVQGKLVPQDPNDEPASELLQRIQVEKEKLIAEGKIKKQKPLPRIAEGEIPYELPEGWVWCRLGEVGLLERGKSKHRPRNEPKLFHNGIYPLVQTGDVSAAKQFSGTIKSYTSKYNDIGLAQSRMWKKGTLCITIAANIAETGFLGFDACFPDSIVGFSSLTDERTSRFVRYFFQQNKETFENFAPSTAQKNLNLGMLNQLVIPLPPLAEQKRIEAKVDQLMQLCNELVQGLQHSKEKTEQLMQAVLHHIWSAGVQLPH